MKPILLALAGALLLAGCATVAEKPLASAGAESGPQAGQVIGYSGSKSNAIIALSPGKAAFGALGGLAMAADGMALVKDHDIRDPAEGMAHDLAADLAKARSAKLASGPIPAGDLKAAEAAQVTTPYVVVVETLGWGFSYFPLDWTHYKVLYNSRLRLVSSASKGNAAVKNCTWDSDKAGRPKLTREQMLGSGATGLKAEIARGAAVCKQTFMTALGLSPQSGL